MTFWAIIGFGLLLLALRRLGADLERRRLGSRPVPLAEPLHVVEHALDLRLGVLELRAPVQRVEGADLDADAAVHAQPVVDVEAIELADAPRLAPLASGRGLVLVALDVDAPVGALPGTQHADRAVVLGEADDAPGTDGRGLLDP